jgi:DNA-binding NtrC family response regulator
MSRSARDLRVLVVEDDVVIAELVRELLLSFDCTVIGPVHNLAGAMRAIRENDIDGALLDIRLHGVSVYPAVSELELRHVPFILMTGEMNLNGFPSLQTDPHHSGRHL